MDSACPEKDATQFLSDSDHSTKVAPTTLKLKILPRKRIRVFVLRDNLSGDIKSWIM